MRLTAALELTGDPPYKVPKNYNRAIQSLIKEALKRENPVLYETYYGDPKKNVQKPYTFSVFIPVDREQSTKNDKVFTLSGNRLKLCISSHDPLFLMTIYNGLLLLKNNQYSPFLPFGLRISGFFKPPDPVLDVDEIVFKTVSPVIVRDIENKKGKGFIGWDHEKFDENLFFAVRNMCRVWLDRDYCLEKESVVIKEKAMKKVKLNHYGGEVGSTGRIKISAPPRVLKLIYNAGLGAKRSQGFGMVEVAP